LHNRSFITDWTHRLSNLHKFVGRIEDRRTFRSMVHDVKDRYLQPACPFKQQLQFLQSLRNFEKRKVSVNILALRIDNNDDTVREFRRAWRSIQHLEDSAWSGHEVS